MSLGYLIFFILGLVVLFFIYVYNSFVKLTNRVKEAWSDIEVQLKRRYDLIPNLIESVKGYAAHEKNVFESVTEARTRALEAKSVKEKEEADNLVTSALKSIFVIAEAYPQLRASENFRELQLELTDTENKIQAARRFYNSVVMELNTKVDMFPFNLIARIFNFNKWEFFEIDQEEKEVVKVNF